MNRSAGVADPFAGVGTALAAANEVNLSAFGIEIDERRAGKARRFLLPVPTEK